MKQNSPWSTVAPARQSTTAAHIPPPGKKLEDLLSVDDETFHRLVRQVDSSLWRAALPGTSRRLRNRIQHALPETGDTENEAPSLVVAGRIEDTRSAHRQILETLARLDGHSPDSVRTSTKREFVG